MATKYATVKSEGQIVIPAEIRHKYQIDERTRIAFVEEDGRLFIQPITDEFIDSMSGILAGRGLPARVERDVPSHPVKQGIQQQNNSCAHENQ